MTALTKITAGENECDSTRGIVDLKGKATSPVWQYFGQCFSYMHSAVFSVPPQKKAVIFVGLISRANGKFKLHTVKVLHPKLS